MIATNQENRVRTESKLVRPFGALGEAERLLSKVRLFAADRECVGAPQSTVFTDEILWTAELRVELGFDAEEIRQAADQAGVAHEDAGLVVVGRARTVKSSGVLRCYRLAHDGFEREFQLDRLAAPLILQDRNGLDVTFALALLNSVQPAPLKPHVAGTWLARKDFRLRPERELLGLRTESLTDEVRSSFGLPTGCMTYVHIEDSIVDADADGDLVTHYVDTDVLSWLASAKNDSWAQQMQAQMAVDLICSVVEKGVNLITSDGANITEPLLDAAPALSLVLSRLAAETGKPRVELAQWAKDDTIRLRSYVESVMALRTASTTAFKGAS